MSLADPRLSAALAAAAVLLLWLAVIWLRRRAAHSRAVSRGRRAVAGEQAAADLLTAAGYRIDATQLCTEWTFWCDGEPITVELRCDALVSRDGRRLVAEVKTGERAPSLTTAATRRQLLEYAVAYRADGVLLVDPEAGAIHEVDFAIADVLTDTDRRPSTRSRTG
ncbi:MAG TPA: hypothetical protein VL172_21385 [Kofleriaceae bacterium]|nr:hypothetical protein [Kofleriaceae bacterium]